MTNRKKMLQEKSAAHKGSAGKTVKLSFRGTGMISVMPVPLL